MAPNVALVTLYHRVIPFWPQKRSLYDEIIIQTSNIKGSGCGTLVDWLFQTKRLAVQIPINSYFWACYSTVLLRQDENGEKSWEWPTFIVRNIQMFFYKNGSILRSTFLCFLLLRKRRLKFKTFYACPIRTQLKNLSVVFFLVSAPNPPTGTSPSRLPSKRSKAVQVKATNERTNERKQKKNRTAPFQAKIKLKNLRKFWSSSACVETSNNKKKKWKKWNFSKPKNSEIVFHALKITKKKGKLWKGGSKNSAKVLLFWPHLCHCEESVYL